MASPDVIKLLDITGLQHLFAVEMPYDADAAAPSSDESSDQSSDPASGTTAP